MPIRDLIWTGTVFDTIDADTLDGKDSLELNPRSELINANTNLNNLTIEKMYYCPSNSIVATLNNCPTTNAFALLVQKHAGINQLLIEYMSSGYKMYIRNCYNNSWGAWERIYTTLDKPTASDVGAIPTSASCNKNWNWNGQGGQPSWLWGGEDGTNMYVYNPSNFSVNYASSAGTASSATTANSASTATVANTAYHLNCSNYGTPIEVGQYIDFHAVGSNVDYSVRLEGTSGHLTCHGNFSASKVYNAVWNDYAELFEKEADDLSAGDILAWGEKGVVKSTMENKNAVVGVYSDTFGHLLGGEEGKSEEENLVNYAPVGLSGRVYVKVIGTVKKGDFIVASEIPGVGRASKTYEPGTVVGKALGSHDGDDIERIQMLIMNI